MEDPRNEIRDVVLGLTDHPSLKGQAAVLQKYFTQDVEFYNVWLNAKGLANLICIYNMGEVFLNYVGCKFQNVAYDETNNNLAVCVCAWMVATWIFVMMWHSLLAIFEVVFGTVMTIQE
ncbi:unnamed protein product [Sphagnum tenellum]